MDALLNQGEGYEGQFIRVAQRAAAPTLFFWKAYLSIEGTLNGNRPS